MSRYPMPFLSEDRGCFCCPATGPSTTYNRGMVSSQFERQSIVSSASNIRVESQSLATQARDSASTFAADLSPLLQDIHLSSLYYSPLSWQGVSENAMAGQRDEIQQNEDMRIMFSSPNISNTSGINESAADQNMSLNFRMLQNRQLGKTSGTMHIDGKSMLSSSAPVTSMGHNVEFSIDQNEDSMGSSGKVNTIDSMDLDSALDELGMLSTITNSRKQYLIETRGQAALKKREQRLRSKSESSPNLTTLGRPNGYRIIQLDTNFVTGLSDMSSAHQPSTRIGDEVPLKSQSSRSEYRNPDPLDEGSRPRRSVPRMSRMRKDRYRRSRCPYKIPNRLCNSMQESDFGPDYFETCASPFLTSASASETGVDTLSDRLSSIQRFSESKSNTASPVKPPQEPRLTRSLSAEDLIPVRRRLEQELSEQAGERSRTEQSLDLMTSEMTNLHMS